MESMQVAAFWEHVEQASLEGGSARDRVQRNLPRAPGWARELGEAYLLQMEGRAREARKLLAEVDEKTLTSEWRGVMAIVQLWIDNALASGPNRTELKERAERLLLGGELQDSSNVVRALHVLSVFCRLLASNDPRLYGEAEEALATAIARADTEILRLWLLDSVAQIRLAEGAFVEARAILDHTIERKAKLGDHLGVAIGAGHVARLALSLHAPLDAALVLERYVSSEVVRHLISMPVSLLRLRNFQAEAVLDQGRRALSDEECSALESLLAESKAVETDIARNLRGYACITLARHSHNQGDHERTRAWIDEAKKEFSKPETSPIPIYWEARIDRTLLDSADWERRMRRLFEAHTEPTEVQVESLLLLAETSWRGQQATRTKALLDEALGLARKANNPAWRNRVIESYRKYSPEEAEWVVVELFSGGGRDTIEHDQADEVTVIFSDLTDFTKRSCTMEAHQVMQTVRTLFDLGVPLLRGRVHPLAYLGDGLLAIVRGPDCQEIAIEFAIDLTRKARHASAFRRVMGEAFGLEIHTGIASGPVVLGTLGSLYKKQYTVIGATVNLAARLCSEAKANEVVADLTSARFSDQKFVEELSLQPKGYELSGPVQAVKYLVEPKRWRSIGALSA